MIGIDKQRWVFAIIAFTMAANASAKDVSGMLLGSFVFSGVLVGLVIGLAVPFIKAVKFWQGGVLAIGLTPLSWVAVLLYWDFPFPDKTLIGNLPLMLLVLIGAVAAYLIAYALVYGLVFGLVYGVISMFNPGEQAQARESPPPPHG